MGRTPFASLLDTYNGKTAIHPAIIFPSKNPIYIISKRVFGQNTVIPSLSFSYPIGIYILRPLHICGIISIWNTCSI